MDEADTEIALAKAAKQFKLMIRDEAASARSPLTTTAIEGLGAACQRMRGGDDDETAGGVCSAGEIYTPAADAQGRIKADCTEFTRQINAKNRQSQSVTQSATAATAAQQPFGGSDPPPLIPRPPDGAGISNRSLTTRRPPCRLSRVQTLQTGVPDAERGTPFGKPMNRRQGQATLAILSMLGFHDGEETVQVGTAAPRSHLFAAGDPRLYMVIGEPGTGKSVVLNAVRRHLMSHGWTHNEFRVLASTGKAAAQVHGSTFASFKGQAGPRAKVNGEKPPPRPPGIEPVFDAGQRKRLQERYGRLRVVLIDEYEMVSCACFALDLSAAPV